ncbi:hypothetical protein [Sphingobium sp. RAC03]|uniref:hypothetical protein n=1 Tax=Sphingobium sp. RAC03 TaxID=1843368 RepID=UPI00083D5CA1|nr:hypothetical protein [Sphingobium sp. RAC03]AOF95413.1 putative lipoprotein [Sphingobium sp. RAC03]
MTPTFQKFLGIALAFTFISGCSPSEKDQTGDHLRSDMPLRDVAFYTENQPQRQEMEAVCADWKSSQRPPASWPSIVVSTCNNVDTANELLRSRKDRDEFKKGMGV